MNKGSSFNEYIRKTITSNWDTNALTDYQGATLQFHDVARKIAKLHIAFEYCGIQPGDKIAICGRNSAGWAVAFLSTLTYGAVAVPILHEFNAEQIHNIVNHSESRLLFVGDFIAKEIDAEQMPALEGIFYLPDLSLLLSRSEKLTYAREHLNMMFGSKYPKNFTRDDIVYHQDVPEELALINYTSGTTGFSKGVMLPYRALWGNLNFCIRRLGDKLKPRSAMLDILPMAHMYGLSIEFIFGFCNGCHLYFLNRLPSPTLIAKAFTDIRPALVITVPLIIEKIIRKKVFPALQNNRMRLLLSMPVVSKKVKEKICEQVYNAFGGQAYEIIVGGAALSKEVEEFLVSIGFPVTVGYGATECAPLISYSDWKEFVPSSCGRAIDNMEVKILSHDPANIPGEIVTRGTNVMLGYYKNQEATDEILKDEWLWTGDMAKMDEDGFIYLVDRKKDVIISGGENIYPVQIEDFLRANDKIKDVAVIGLPDPRLGEISAAIIEIKPNMEATEDEINEFCKELPRYKRPRKIIFADIPRNPTGKIEKPVLRERYCDMPLVEAQIRS